MEATAVTMLHAAPEPADVNKAAMTEILFCLIKPTWFNLYKRFLFPSQRSRRRSVFPASTTAERIIPYQMLNRLLI